MIGRFLDQLYAVSFEHFYLHCAPQLGGRFHSLEPDLAGARTLRNS